MSLQPLSIPPENRDATLLSPVDYDADAVSIRSDQDTDSDDDELQLRARNSRELRAADRMVFLEEDETEKMITDARQRQRRGSGLPVPNPLKYLSRRYSHSSSTSRSPSRAALNSTDSLVSSERLERRQLRRERRRHKKERLLLSEAREGEDGILMQEMEEGGMKEGSSTGESSDRDDSEEIDRKGLLGSGKTRQTRRWRCGHWVLVHLSILVALVILVLVAWKLSIKKRLATTQNLVSNGTALFAPTTIIISLDGFRADFVNRGLTPRLNAFIQEGVSPLYMLPSFPSVTFPNHYTLATGLYPESHGIVGNSFWDPSMQAEFFYTDPARSMQPKWWGGEPFWVTAEKAGMRTAIHMWPGSEAHISQVEPAFLDEFNGKEKLPNKVRRIFELLDKPGAENANAKVDDMRPQLIAAYVPDVDADGHSYGPNSTEIRATIKNADDMLDQIFHGLEQRNLTNIVNVMVVSDHGMATTDVSRLIQLEDLVDMNRIEHNDGWPLVGLRPKNPDDLNDIYQGILDKTKNNPNVEVYLRDENMPERYHFSKSDRIAPLWIVPKTGWAVIEKHEFDIEEAKKKNLVYHPRGLHGYDHEHPLMRAIFVARGPAFPHAPGSRVEPFQNIEVYNILCDSIGLKPMPNNGTLRLPLKPVGKHDSDNTIEEPQDPVSSYILSATSSADLAAPTRPIATPSEVDSKPSNPVEVNPVKGTRPTVKPADEQQDEHSGSTLEEVWSWVQNKWDELLNKVKESF